MKIKTLDEPKLVAFYAQTYVDGKTYVGECVCSRPESTRMWKTLLHSVNTDDNVRWVSWKVVG